MSNRVRVLFYHPEHGPYMGRYALQFVEQHFQAVNQKRMNKFILPDGFAAWPRWKRAFWMAKRLGANWKMQIFREPRRTKAAKSVFWKAAEAIGFARPKRKSKVQLKKKEEKPKRKGIRLVNGGEIRWDAQPIQLGPEVNVPAPQDPQVGYQVRQQRQLNEIYDELMRREIGQIRGRAFNWAAVDDVPEPPEPEGF